MKCVKLYGHTYIRMTSIGELADEETANATDNEQHGVHEEA